MMCALETAQMATSGQSNSSRACGPGCSGDCGQARPSILRVFIKHSTCYGYSGVALSLSGLCTSVFVNLNTTTSGFKHRRGRSPSPIRNQEFYIGHLPPLRSFVSCCGVRFPAPFPRIFILAKCNCFSGRTGPITLQTDLTSHCDSQGGSFRVSWASFETQGLAIACFRTWSTTGTGTRCTSATVSVS
jgi:hypothetical protein